MANQTRYEYICHPLFLAVAAALNLPPLVFGILGWLTWCSYYSGWLVGNACLTATNMVAAMYSVYKLRRFAGPYSIESDNNLVERNDVEKNSDDTQPNYEPSEVGSDESPLSQTRGCFSRLVELRTVSSDRIRHLICYDGIIATYSILFLFWVFWISEGTQRVRQQEWATEEDLDGCLEYHERYMKTSLVCGFSYFSFVTLAALSSLCFKR